MSLKSSTPLKRWGLVGGLRPPEVCFQRVLGHCFLYPSSASHPSWGQLLHHLLPVMIYHLATGRRNVYKRNVCLAVSWNFQDIVPKQMFPPFKLFVSDVCCYNGNLVNNKHQKIIIGLGDGSVGKVPTAQLWGPAFRAPALTKKSRHSREHLQSWGREVGRQVDEEWSSLTGLG